jgi:hypothetical protein
MEGAWKKNDIKQLTSLSTFIFTFTIALGVLHLLSFGIVFPMSLYVSFPLRIKRIKRGKTTNFPPNISK